MWFSILSLPSALPSSFQGEKHHSAPKKEKKKHSHPHQVLITLPQAENATLSTAAESLLWWMPQCRRRKLLHLHPDGVFSRGSRQSSAGTTALEVELLGVKELGLLGT